MRRVSCQDYGKKTASGDTAIVLGVRGDPSRAGQTRLTSLWYNNTAGSSAAHVLTVMRPLNMKLSTAAALGSQGDITISADPGTYGSSVSTGANVIAANDYVVVDLPDGTILVSTVNAWNGTTKVLSLNSNLPMACPIGTRVWFFGIKTDTNPNDGLAHPIFRLPAAVTTYFDDDNGFVGSVHGSVLTSMDGRGQPLLLSVDNVTTAGVIEKVSVGYFA